jgi:hypothetical protein
VSAKRISGVSVSVYFWRIFTTCHHLVTQKNPMALFVKQFAKVARQILRNFFFNHQILTRVPAGQQNIAGFLKYSIFISDLQLNLAISPVWLNHKIQKKSPWLVRWI